MCYCIAKQGDNVITEDTKIIEITEKAINQLEVIFEKEQAQSPLKGLRIGVVGGGCSGLSYKMEFDNKKDKDYILELGEVKIFIDPKSAIYLKGITLEFQDGLQGKGFVFNNPNAKNTCGCGESFSI